jgi:hypothetical protein
MSFIILFSYTPIRLYNCNCSSFPSPFSLPMAPLTQTFPILCSCWNRSYYLQIKTWNLSHWKRLRSDFNLCAELLGICLEKMCKLQNKVHIWGHYKILSYRWLDISDRRPLGSFTIKGDSESSTSPWNSPFQIPMFFSFSISITTFMPECYKCLYFTHFAIVQSLQCFYFIELWCCG